MTYRERLNTHFFGIHRLRQVVSYVVNLLLSELGNTEPVPCGTKTTVSVSFITTSSPYTHVVVSQILSVFSMVSRVLMISVGIVLALLSRLETVSSLKLKISVSQCHFTNFSVIATVYTLHTIPAQSLHHLSFKLIYFCRLFFNKNHVPGE